MNLHYKITFLYFKKGMTVEEITMILDSEIRKSDENKRKVRGMIVKDPPAAFVSRCVNIEKGQIYANSRMPPV